MISFVSTIREWAGSHQRIFLHGILSKSPGSCIKSCKAIVRGINIYARNNDVCKTIIFRSSYLRSWLLITEFLFIRVLWQEVSEVSHEMQMVFLRCTQHYPVIWTRVASPGSPGLDTE